VIPEVLSLSAALALLRGAATARTIGLAAAAFGLIGTPVGIALGAFTAAILLPERSSTA